MQRENLGSYTEPEPCLSGRWCPSRKNHRERQETDHTNNERRRHSGSKRPDIDRAQSIETSSKTNGTLDPVGLQGAFTLIDARIGLGDSNGRWYIALVGKNLTDEAVLNNTQSFLGNYIGQIRAPRTLAVQVDLRFGG